MLVERNISIIWIERILANPLHLERDKEDSMFCHALGRIPEYGDRILRVIYNDTVEPWDVITAFFDRKAGRVL
jgi:hypothetical protein